MTGGAGFIGTCLSKELISKGYDVAFLVHWKDKISPNSFYCNPESGQFDEKVLDFAQSVIHLAGANIGGGRWTEKRKKEIVKSRVEATMKKGFAVIGDMTITGGIKTTLKN